MTGHHWRGVQALNALCKHSPSYVFWCAESLHFSILVQEYGIYQCATSMLLSMTGQKDTITALTVEFETTNPLTHHPLPWQPP